MILRGNADIDEGKLSYCHPVQKMVCYVFHSTEILPYIKFVFILLNTCTCESDMSVIHFL